MGGLTYDTGALIAAGRGDRRMWLLHEGALARGVAPTIPTPVMVEAWRGEAVMARLIRGCTVRPLSEADAKAAGVLLGLCELRVSATDAVVVAGALSRGDDVVTGDRGDLLALAAGAGRRLALIDL